MKKQIIAALALTALGIFTNAQTGRVGINTQDPKTTMDVSGKVDGSGISLITDVTGLQAPRLTRKELTDKGDSLYGTDQKGALVYITDTALGDALTQRANITTVGYYYFDGALWQKVGSGSSSGGSGTVTSVTGTLPISVSASTTAPVVSISTANTSTNGALTSTDWNTFNNKVSSVGTAGAPITIGGTATAPTIGITRNNIVAGTSVSTATSPLTLDAGATNAVVGGANATLTVNNDAPLWNANKLQNVALSSTAPTDKQVLQYNNTTTRWEPTNYGGWSITGNTSTTPATALSAAVGTTNYLGTTDAKNLVFATDATTKAILDTDGTLRGGNDGSTTSYASFAWGSKNTIDNTSTTSNVALGRENTIATGTANFPSIAIGYNNRTSTGGRAIGNSNNVDGAASFFIGNSNTVDGLTTGAAGTGFAFGRSNKMGGGFAFGASNTANTFGFTIGLNNVAQTAAKSVVLGFGGTALGGQNVYANTTHAFFGDTMATTSKVGINVLPSSTTTFGDLLVNKAVQIVETNGASVAPTATCDANSVGSIVYWKNTGTNLANFYGCRQTAAATFGWTPF